MTGAGVTSAAGGMGESAGPGGIAAPSLTPAEAGPPGASRADVLGLIRRSLGVKGSEAIRRAAVEDRLASAPVGVVPARGRVDGEARLELFARMAAGAQSAVTVVDGPGAVPGAVAGALRERNLPARLRFGADPFLAAMPWDATALELSRGPSVGDDLVGLSRAAAGVAETGTLVLESGPENPTTLNFLPDLHVVVLREADLFGDYEATWAALRARHGKVGGLGAMPRTVNWVTGPSRSADIEQTLLLGAHGPRDLHVVVVRGT